MQIMDRFLAKVDRDGPDGCWLWTGGKSSGYGRIGQGGHKVLYAHRFIYESVHGPIPEGMEIDHICQNRACVNPDHLRVASHAQNGCNRPSPRNSSLGLKGVTFAKWAHKFRSQIGVNGGTKHLGYFDSVEDAHAAYVEAATRLHGEFACAGVD